MRNHHRQTQKMEWLGFALNSETMAMTIPENKLQKAIEETNEWVERHIAGRRELQTWAGHFTHISLCIHHSKKFMFRTLLQLRTTPEGEWTIGQVHKFTILNLLTISIITLF